MDMSEKDMGIVASAFKSIKFILPKVPFFFHYNGFNKIAQSEKKF